MTLEQAQTICKELTVELGRDFGPVPLIGTTTEFHIGLWNGHALMQRYSGHTTEEVRKEYHDRQNLQ